MKYVILTFYIVLTAMIGNSQKDHLEPAKDISSYSGQVKNYYDSIFLLLDHGFSHKLYARYTSLPSFTREYAFSVESQNGQYIIIANSLPENFWYDKKRSHIRVISSTNEIDEGLYRSIGDLFHLLAIQTRKSENTVSGKDGTTYYFDTADSLGNRKAGEIWSPDKNSRMGRVIEICDRLYSLGEGNDGSQQNIQNSIEQLITDLK